MERERKLMRRDDLVRYLAQRRDRAVFWNDKQMYPSQALKLAQALDEDQVVSVWQEYIATDSPTVAPSLY